MAKYSALPGVIPGNVPSQAFEATQTSEFGDAVGLAPGSGYLNSARVLMSSWGCGSGSWNLNNCSTTPGSIVGAGVGWSKREYDALGQSFETRGRRMDEIIDLLRAAWRDDPVTFDGAGHHLDEIRLLPKPAGEIPICIGGGVEASFRRAVAKGDGFHIVGLKPPVVVPMVERLRRDRPEPAFTISARTGWDPQGMDAGLFREENAAFEAAGIQHMVAAPWQKDIDAWLRSMDLLAEIVRPG